MTLIGAARSSVVAYNAGHGEILDDGRHVLLLPDSTRTRTTDVNTAELASWLLTRTRVWWPRYPGDLLFGAGCRRLRRTRLQTTDTRATSARQTSKTRR